MHPAPVHLLDRDAVGELDGSLAELTPTPQLIVFDTLARSILAADENSAAEMGRVVEVGTRLVQDYGSTVLYVHHSGLAGGRERGSTSFPGAMDARWEIERPGMGSAVKLQHRKDKDAAEQPTIHLTLREVGDSLVVVGANEEMGQHRFSRVIDAIETCRALGGVDPSKGDLTDAVGGNAQKAHGGGPTGPPPDAIGQVVVMN